MDQRGEGFGSIGDTREGDERTVRRDFLKKVGRSAAAAPAVALVLSAVATPAHATGRYGDRDLRWRTWRRHRIDRQLGH